MLPVAVERWFLGAGATLGVLQPILEWVQQSMHWSRFYDSLILLLLPFCCSVEPHNYNALLSTTLDLLQTFAPADHLDLDPSQHRPWTYFARHLTQNRIRQQQM